MAIPPNREEKPLLKNPLFYSWSIIGIVCLAVLYVMASRWLDAQRIERQAAQERAQKQREQDVAAVEQMGGKEFTILDFYASPREIRRGESAQLCYGVSNAKTVTLEPQTAAVWPSMARCVDVSPTKTTAYTLEIEDGAGHKKSQTVQLEVH
ncbi:MAG TPA: hypothetical protein VJN93_16600 [Candidatus Acidoferrum sp.]|nr:hypothetical protein [Candidatus Acidoferrum sp.]